MPLGKKKFFNAALKNKDNTVRGTKVTCHEMFQGLIKAQDSSCCFAILPYLSRNEDVSAGAKVKNIVLTSYSLSFMPLQMPASIAKLHFNERETTSQSLH